MGHEPHYRFGIIRLRHAGRGGPIANYAGRRGVAAVEDGSLAGEACAERDLSADQKSRLHKKPFKPS